MYTFKDYDGGASYSGDILETCQALTEELLNKGVKYSQSQLIWNDIERCYRDSTHICCATYVSLVFYLSGRITEEQANAFNYHYTDDINHMFAAAGFTKHSYSDAQPGDAVIHHPGASGHALIYAGDGMCWDQSSITDGTGSMVSRSEQYLSESEFWRAP